MVKFSCIFFVIFGSFLDDFCVPGGPLGSLWAPLGALGAPLGTPGAPLGVQGRKSDEKHSSCPMVRGPFWDNFFDRNCFFHKKVCPRSVFLAVCVLFLVLDRFFLNFLRPGTTKTAILVKSGIEIKKITKSNLELPRERLWESFWFTFLPF